MKKINNIYDVFKTLEELKTQKEYYEESINKYKKHIKKPSDFNEWKIAIKLIDKDLNDCINIISKYSTFNSSYLLQYILRCINSHENEEYVITEITQNDSYLLQSSYISYVPKFKKYYLIIEKKYLDELEKINNIFIHMYLPNVYNKILGESKRIKLALSPDINVFKDGVFLSNFKDFPYLEEILLNVINCKYKNPTIPDNILLNTEKDNIKKYTLSNK